MRRCRIPGLRHHWLARVRHGISWRHHALGIALLRIALWRIPRLRVSWRITLRWRHVPLWIPLRRRHVPLRITLRRIAGRHPWMLLIPGRHALGIALWRRIARRHPWVAGLRVRHPGRGWWRIRVGRVLAHGVANYGFRWRDSSALIKTERRLRKENFGGVSSDSRLTMLKLGK